MSNRIVKNKGEKLTVAEKEQIKYNKLEGIAKSKGITIEELKARQKNTRKNPIPATTKEAEVQTSDYDSYGVYRRTAMPPFSANSVTDRPVVAFVANMYPDENRPR